jgi:hypothetical protein
MRRRETGCDLRRELARYQVVVEGAKRMKYGSGTDLCMYLGLDMGMVQVVVAVA